MIPVHSRAMFILPSGAKKNCKIVSDYFAVLAIFYCWFGCYFALVWKIDTTSPACECSCILFPNFENFCLNNGQFFSVGAATASLASPCSTLMAWTLKRKIVRWMVDCYGYFYSIFDCISWSFVCDYFYCTDIFVRTYIMNKWWFENKRWPVQ